MPDSGRRQIVGVAGRAPAAAPDFRPYCGSLPPVSLLLLRDQKSKDACWSSSGASSGSLSVAVGLRWKMYYGSRPSSTLSHRELFVISICVSDTSALFLSLSVLLLLKDIILGEYILRMRGEYFCLTAMPLRTFFKELQMDFLVKDLMISVFPLRGLAAAACNACTDCSGMTDRCPGCSETVSKGIEDLLTLIVNPASPQSLAMLKEQLRQALAAVEAKERVLHESLRPKTLEEVELLRGHLTAAIEELRERSQELATKVPAEKTQPKA